MIPAHQGTFSIGTERTTNVGNKGTYTTGDDTGRRPSPHTVKRVLATTPPPQHHQRRFPPYHALPDPFERRRAIVRLHLEGWNKKSIASYLQINRSTVYDTLRRWVAEGLTGLHHKSRARHPRPRVVTLRTVEAVRTLQRNPYLGAWRIAAALKQQGMKVSPRTVVRIMAQNREMYPTTIPPRTAKPKQPMPFAAVRRHRVPSGCLDNRYSLS